ncbi:MAG: hypothetical protein RL616_312 [Verrucomicrobiota bacterium]|jgi:hypothetical protein
MDHSPEPREITTRFEKLLAALAADRVDYAVVGGLAVIFNGYPRLTLDADILVADTPDNLRRLIDCLTKWGEGWARELKPEDFSELVGAIRVIEDFELDVFTRMNDRLLEDFRPRLRFLETANTRIAYLSPEDLIFLKQGSWREKDQFDVAAMREIIAREAGK